MSNAIDSTERPTVIDELRHLPAADMMRICRQRRDQEEARRIMALYGEASVTDASDARRAA